MHKKLPIFYSAILLTCVNLLLRFVSTSFQVYLSGRIGAEGIGLLQLVLSVGSMAMVAGMAGIRTATMYLTAEEHGRNQKKNTLWVISGCLRYSLVCSISVGVLVYTFAPFVAEHWIGNLHTVDSIRLFAVFLPINCLCGVMVGYFTGAGRIVTLAAVEVIEQLFSMVCTLTLLSLWGKESAEKACLCVVLGSGLGACLTLLCLCFLRLRHAEKPGNRIPLLKRLYQTAVPLAVADDLRTGITTVENLMVPKRLARYPGEISPLASYGIVCGMVFPILTFPLAILFGLTELLIPELARCNAAGSRKRICYLVKKSLKIALLFGCLCGGILFLTSQWLCEKLYANALAGTYLKWFAPLAVLLYCDSVTDAMIKGLGQQKMSVRYNIFTNILDVLFLFFLLPRYGIKGYFFSFLITHVINFLLSIGRLLRITKIAIPMHIPLLTLLVACTGVFLCTSLKNAYTATFSYCGILLCGLFLTGILKSEDLRWVKGLLQKK